MLELLDIRFSFLCRSTHCNREGKSPIVLRVIYRGERRDIFTGLYCFKDDWDSESGKLFKIDKTTAAINQNLELISRKSHDAFDTLKFSGSPFTIDELVNRLMVFLLKL